MQVNDFFTNKNIISLNSGLQYFFALAREEIKPINEWNNEDLTKWMDQIGFSDYSKVVRYNEWSGAEFSGMIDKKFMLDTLGITREDLKIKLETEVKNSG
jgi:hypothetical protein